MTTVAFIGLGIMGGPMAANLVKAGFDVIGYNRSPDKVDALVEAGGRGADERRRGRPRRRRGHHDGARTPRTSRRSPAATDGVFANAKPGALYIDMSSIRPDVAVRAGRGRAQGAGCGCWTPRSAAARPARSRRSLSIMVGGDAGGLRGRRSRCWTRSARPSCTSGPPGSGQTVKAANQLIVAGNIELLAEAIVFLEAYGVDTEAALEVLGGGLAGSTVLDRKGANMLAREFTPGFRIALHHKDMGIVTVRRPRGRRRRSRSARSSPSWSAAAGRPRRRRPGPLRPAASSSTELSGARCRPATSTATQES